MPELKVVRIRINSASLIFKSRFQVILAGTLTGVQGDIPMQSFGGPFHSKTT